MRYPLDSGMTIEAQAVEARMLLGYNDGDLLNNVQRFKWYAESELALIRKGNERLLAYTRNLEALIKPEQLQSVQQEALAEKFGTPLSQS